MSRQQPPRLTSMVEHVISQALTGGPGASPQLESSRTRLLGVVTIVVTGRRGAGKTTVVNQLLSEGVAEVGYSAEDRPAHFFASDVENTPAWGVATLVSPSLTRGRWIVELPEHMTAGDVPLANWPAGLDPDLLVHVTRQPARSDELDWLDRAQRHWSLGPLETLVLGRDQPPPSAIGTSPEDLPRQIQALERLVEARRCDEVMQSLAALAARSDDRTWAGRLVDDLERLSLTPEGHVLRERWALEACLSRRADIPQSLRDEVVRLTVGQCTATPPDRKELLVRAGHWRAQVSVLPPLAAEVARAVARRLQLDAAARTDVARDEGAVQ